MGKSAKVDFIIIGAQKCGTTYLSNALAAHPEVCFSRVKEPFYFNRTSEWDGIEEYHSLFDPKPGQVCGEASTHYTFLPIYSGTASKIFEYNSDMKLIYLMREPFDRMLSLYRFKRIRNETRRGFAEDVLSDPEYLHVGRYYTQLMPYLDLFDRSQIKLIIFEDFIEGTTSHLREVSSFLGVDESFYADIDESFGTNASRGRKYPPPGVQIIRELLHPIKSLVDTRLFRYVKDKLYQEPSPPSYDPEFRSAVRRSFQVETSRLEAEILGREIAAWWKVEAGSK